MTGRSFFVFVVVVGIILISCKRPRCIGSIGVWKLQSASMGTIL